MMKSYIDILQEAFAEADETLRRLVDAIGNFDEQDEAPISHKIPKPPKYLGPANNANHTANRPPRRARSSCYKRHR